MPFNPYVSPLTEGRVEVPLLTEMVKKSKDVDLMPGVHVYSPQYTWTTSISLKRTIV